MPLAGFENDHHAIAARRLDVLTRERDTSQYDLDNRALAHLVVAHLFAEGEIDQHSAHLGSREEDARTCSVTRVQCLDVPALHSRRPFLVVV
jgi:hypothetical protein